MPGNFAQAAVVAGTAATAAQFNGLRKDAITNAGDYVTSTGSGDAYVVAIDTAIVAYSAGLYIKFKANFDNYGEATINVNGMGAKYIIKRYLNASTGTVRLNQGDIRTGHIVELVYDGTDFYMVSSHITEKALGTGADGALAQSSGTIALDYAGAKVVVKNYTYVDVSGTAALVPINPHAGGTILIIKCRFALFTTSATRGIDLRGLGAAGGAGVATGSGNAGGTFGFWQGMKQVAAQTSVAAGAGVGSGGGGGGSSMKNSGTDGTTTGTAGGTGSVSPGVQDENVPYTHFMVLPGSGGASASTGNNNSSNTNAVGARGAGAMIVLAAGVIIISCVVDISGSVGGNANAGNKGGGGGGGGGGAFAALGSSVDTTGATFTKNGGAGGTGDGTGGNGGTGGEGLVYTGTNTEFI